MSSGQALLDHVIVDQKRGIRYHVSFSITLFLIGASAVLIGLFLPSRTATEIPKQMLAIGGIFIASLTAFPVKEILSRRERISMLQKIAAMRLTLDEQERARMDEIAWKAVERIVTG
jgi:hypothetical protein